MKEEKGRGAAMENQKGSTHLDERVRMGDLDWKEFFGSSLSLSSGLISIYDDVSRGMSLVANIPAQTFTDTVMMNKTSVAENVIDDISIAGNSSVCEGKRSFDQERRFNHIRVSVSMDCDEAEVLQKPLVLEADVVSSRSRRDAQSRVEDGSDVRFSLPVTLPVSVFQETDDRKRPLSISSTSSSASSSSSLPRHVRKRMANMSSAAAGGGGGGGCSAAEASGYDASCETLSTVAECSPADVHCSPSAIRFFNKDIIVDRVPSAGLRNGPLDGIRTTGSHQYISQITDDYSANSDVDVEESTSSSARNSFDCLMPSFDSQELKLLTGTVYIERVVSEILETERSYVKDLSDIVQGYIGHLKENSELELSSEVFEALFGNIETICQFNRYFLTKLVQCDHDPIKIAGCFVSETDGFVIYSTYCTNYPRSMETLMRCMKDEKIATILKQQQISLQHGLPLGSYLLKPVQRILKYHILLQNIFNNHDTSEEGHAVIEKALDAMMKVAAHINEMKRQHEHAVHIQEIQSHLCDWDGADLTTLGGLILEEKFRLCGAKAMRHLYLFEKALLIAKEKEDGMFLVKGFILFSNLMVIESVPKEPLSFQVIPYNSPREQCTFQANNLEQKRLWCHWLKKLMLENYGSKIPEKAKELVMMLGKSRDEEDYESSNLEILELVKKQHSAPEYLEKRKDRRRKSTGGFIQDLKLKPKKGPKSGTPTTDTSKQKRERCKAGDRKSTDRQPVTDDEESFNISCDDDNLNSINISNNSSGINVAGGTTPPTSTSDYHKSDASFNSKDSFSSATSPNDKIRAHEEVISGIFSTPTISSVSAFPQVSRTLRTISVTDLQTPTHNNAVNEPAEDKANDRSCYSPPQKSENTTSRSAASLGRVFENVVGPYGSSFHRSNSVGFELQGDSNDSVFCARWTEEESYDVVSNQSNSQESEVIDGKRFNSLRKLPLVPVSRAHGANSLSQSALDESLNSDLSREDDSSTEPATGRTSSSHLRSPSHGNICYGRLISITKLDDKYHTVARVVGRNLQANGSQWPNVKPGNSLKSNPENKIMFSGNCNDDDIDDDNDYLNSVHSALTRLSSKLPAESLQSVSSCSTIRAGTLTDDISTDNPDILSGKNEDRRDLKNRLARLLGRSPNIGQRKVHKLLPTGNASCSSLSDVLKDRHSAIGERMAVSPDTTFDSVFTLANRTPHQRPLLFDCKDLFRESQSETGVCVLPLDGTSDSSAVNCDAICKSRSTPEFKENSSDKDIKVTLANLEKESFIDKQANAISVQFQAEKNKESEEEFYYENKLLQDLEDGLRTSDCDDYEEVKSDEDTNNDIKIIYTPTVKPSAHIPRMTIKETLHSIERRSHSRPVRKVEVQLGEKAQGIREILHTLENGNKNGQDSSGLYSMFPNKMPHRTVRDRTRELAVCAAITRLRQNNCTLSSLESVAVEQDCFGLTQNQCCDVTESRELGDQTSHL